MLIEIDVVEEHDVTISPVEMVYSEDDADQEAERRRLMYERIAQGNALAEAEENARRKWRGK